MLSDRQKKLTYDIPEAAALLGVSASHAYERIQAGDFPVPVIRIGTRIVIARVALDTLLGIAPAGKEVGTTGSE